jgi:hypothetical protein
MLARRGGEAAGIEHLDEGTDAREILTHGAGIEHRRRVNNRHRPLP